MDRKIHWNQVYQTNAADDVSWFQARPAISLKLIESTGIARDSGIVDVGGGASVLVDYLLDEGFTRIGVLDISEAALELARERLGVNAGKVGWFNSDVTEFDPPHRFHVWHDRAVFHFLTEAGDRRKYVEVLKRAIVPEGNAVIATFAIDGPLKCSGLDVARYDAQSICGELGPGFKLIEQVDETHTTPWDTRQRFSYFRFVRLAGSVGVRE